MVQYLSFMTRTDSESGQMALPEGKRKFLSAIGMQTKQSFLCVKN